ncbi:MAG TPA: hypothetical protein VD996_05770 [Chitinophagaceae bacterium]|nr:hypothetical protein [Chitinophagaceae bacterium]
MVVAHRKVPKRSSKDCLDGSEVLTVYHARMPARELLSPDRFRKTGKARPQVKTVPRK